MSLLIGGAAAAAVGGTTYALTRGRIRTGAPHPVTRQALGQSRSEGRAMPIVGGALAWDRNLEAEDATTVELPSGRRVDIDSAAAAFHAYRIAILIGDSMNRFASLFYQTTTEEQRAIMYRGFRESGVYDLSALSPLSLQLLTQTINAGLQFSTSLRVLSRVYRVVGFAVSHRPAEAARGRIDLRNVVFRGFWNPMAEHTGEEPTNRVSQVRNPQDWERLGLAFIAAIMDAYPDLVPLPADDRELYVAEALESQERTEAETMGAISLINVGLLIAIVIVGWRVGVALKERIASVFPWLGGYSQYARALADEYEEFMEMCRDTDLPEAQRREACDRAERLGEQLANYDEEMPLIPRLLLIGGGTIAAGYGAWYSYKRWGRPKVKKYLADRKKGQKALPK